MGVDVFSQLKDLEPGCELFIIDKTVDELEKIQDEQKGKFKDQAKIALQMVKKFKIKHIRTKTFKNVDKIIEEKAKTGYAVATQDRELKANLKKNGIQTFVLRQKKIHSKGIKKCFTKLDYPTTSEYHLSY